MLIMTENTFIIFGPTFMKTSFYSQHQKPVKIWYHISYHTEHSRVPGPLKLHIVVKS